MNQVQVVWPLAVLFVGAAIIAYRTGHGDYVPGQYMLAYYRRPRTPVAVLRQARILLADPTHLVRHVFAVDKYGTPVDEGSKQAVAWCPWGAIRRVAAGNRVTEHAATAYLSAVARAALGFSGGYTGYYPGMVVLWADDPARTHAEILAAFDQAIALAEAGT